MTEIKKGGHANHTQRYPIHTFKKLLISYFLTAESKTKVEIS